MNIIQKGTINEIKKKFRKKKKDRDLTFAVAKTKRDLIKRLLIVSGKVGENNIELYEAKAKDMEADFVVEEGSSWVLTRKTIQENYDPDFHQGVLLIGDNSELPGTQIEYDGTQSFTDWYIQDVDDDGLPDTPIGRVFGPPATVMYHMDPFVIDSNIAIVFDSQPGRSTRHVDSLASLGFDVEVLRRFYQDDIHLLGAAEFILQFSDGVFTSRIHGTPDRWASHNSVILSHSQAELIDFAGYTVIYSEACSTAREGPLLKAFLNRGACYIGASLDTMNNIEQFVDWRDCPYADGWKFGFLDFLDTFNTIGRVKLEVDREIAQRLRPAISKEIETIGRSDTNKIEQDQTVSSMEWMLYGNPIRRTTVGPNADFTPDTLIVDT